MTPHYGATPDEWRHLSIVLGLTPDLLPVVSRPDATISPQSKLQGLGKTPSRYNASGHVAGIQQWTQHQSTGEEVRAWSRQPDLGICLQARTVRFIDVDVPDPAQARPIHDAIHAALADVPCRRRANSGKFLVAFTLPGDYTKRSFKVEGGIVEFLATGQQAVVAGTHPSGARYEWAGGLPDEFPTVTPEQFEALWGGLVKRFAIEAPMASKTPLNKKDSINAATENDPVARFLIDNGWVLAQARDGRLDIRCPFESQHGDATSISATVYFPAYTGGRPHGGFDCKHAHCQGRTHREFLAGIKFPERDALDDFAVVETKQPAGVPRFTVIPEHEFTQGKPPTWIVKGVIPEAQLVVVFGESGSGKSFLALDLLASVAQGLPWRGQAVKQGRCVYVAAEGAGGFRKRLTAYKQHHDIERLDIGVIPDAPDLMKVDDVKALIASVNLFGPVSVIVVDTFAQAMPGANENSGEDVGKALGHCKALNKHTGAVVMLVHHSGKDATRGARGWSGLRAAADAEIEVTRCDADRVATVTKQKDGEDGEDFGFRLHTVIVGVDEDGEPVSSCVLEHVAAVPKGQRKRAAKGANEVLLMRVLDELTTLSGDGPYPGEWRAAAKNKLPAPTNGQADRRDFRLSRAEEGLIAAGIVEQDSGGRIVKCK